MSNITAYLMEVYILDKYRYLLKINKRIHLILEKLYKRAFYYINEYLSFNLFCNFNNIDNIPTRDD